MELANLITDYHKYEITERKIKARNIRYIENKIDELTRGIMRDLEQNIRTPIDKKDIERIATFIDDIADLIDAVASRLIIFGIERIDEYTEKLVKIANNAVSEVNDCILNLRNLKKKDINTTKIRELEKEAGNLYDEAIAELFHFYKNSIDIIKYKEIYELLEKIVDKCKDMANVIDIVLIKHN